MDSFLLASTPENLITACHDCNAGKSDLMPEFN